LVLGLVPLRNAIATGETLWLPVRSGENLFVGRGVPPGVRLDDGAQSPLAPAYRLLGLSGSDAYVRAAELARQAPEAFFGPSLHYLGYTLGLQESSWGHPAHPEFVVLWLLYLIAWLAWRQTGRLECWLIHSFVLTHVAVVALYGYNAYPPR